MRAFLALGRYGLMVAIVVTALLFDPVRKWIQEKLDLFFYRTRYDYRRTLVEFGRELSSETDLDKMLSSLVDRLARTLLVDRLAIFLGNNDSSRFELSKSFGLGTIGAVDLAFLAKPRIEDAAGHIFFENTRQLPRETGAAQEAISRLDLNYYIPCHARQKTIAFLGLGKTMEGDFLSSEDVDLLETLAGYIAIAIQNARLYASLEQKVSEYERLKDFNENIVESINVGVLAVDLQDRIESWNSQMEVMYAKPRWQVVGRSLSEVFPAAFVEEFYRVRQNPGIHNLYKFRLATPTGESRSRECGHRAAGDTQVQRGWAPRHHGRHHRAHRTRSPAHPGRQTFFHWPAGCRSCTRGEYSAGRNLFLHADAGQATAVGCAEGLAA